MAGIEGMDKFLAELESIERRLPEEVNKFMQRLGEHAKGSIKALTPVDTGHLRLSIFRKRISNWEQVIYSNTEYAFWVNDGYKRKNGKIIKGVRMFDLGIKATEDAMPKMAEEFIKKVMKK